MTLFDWIEAVFFFLGVMSLAIVIVGTVRHND